MRHIGILIFTAANAEYHGVLLHRDVMHVVVSLIKALNDLFIFVTNLIAHLSGETHRKTIRCRVRFLSLVHLFYQFEHETVIELLSLVDSIVRTE